MISKIKAFWKRITYFMSKEYCCDQMEKEGIAVFGMCPGMIGGDKQTNYLSYSCIDCPHFVVTTEERSKIK